MTYRVYGVFARVIGPFRSPRLTLSPLCPPSYLFSLSISLPFFALPVVEQTSSLSASSNSDPDVNRRVWRRTKRIRRVDGPFVLKSQEDANKSQNDPKFVIMSGWVVNCTWAVFLATALKWVPALKWSQVLATGCKNSKPPTVFSAVRSWNSLLYCRLARSMLLQWPM